MPARDTTVLVGARLLAWVLVCLVLGCVPARPTSVVGDGPAPGQQARAGWGLARAAEEVRRLVRDHAARDGVGPTADREIVPGPGGPAVPLVLHALREPLEGLVEIEAQVARALVDLALPGPDLSAIATLAGLGSPLASPVDIPAPPPPPASLDDHLAFVEAVLLLAHELREQALAGLSEPERRVLFEQAATLASGFSPQYRAPDPGATVPPGAAAAFVRLVRDRVDFSRLLAAAAVLRSLQDPAWLEAVARAATSEAADAIRLPTVAGRLAGTRQTTAGWIVIGGREDNVYEMDGRIAVLLDLGGSDSYRGAVAADHALPGGNHLLIDLAGDDRYDGTALGLATGRLGVSMLLDLAGDDVYEMREGAGGTGFAGIGLLVDRDGRDRYVGTRWSQGVGIAGLGVVLDRRGDDVWTIDGYGLGLGAPAGLGVVLDLGGDDAYTCRDVFSSAYNEIEAPEAKPGDPGFQYESFCLGVGVGQRVLGEPGDGSPHELPGGVGLLIDLAGDDRYRSANFSQGTGYFWGLGVKVDGAGRDEHDGARYGHGAAAHRGVGLFVDAAGEDRYGSRGPYFNGGTAWDKSVAAFLDAGPHDDRYDLERSDGLGRAAHASWSLAVDEAGEDWYRLSRGLGLADADSASTFVDLEGADDYPAAPLSDGWAPVNGRTISRGGGLFVDR